jgi:hypothetical protein
MCGLFSWREHHPRKLAEHELRRLEHPANESRSPLLSGGMEYERTESIKLCPTGGVEMVQKRISRLGLVVSDVQPLPTRCAQHICWHPDPTRISGFPVDSPLVMALADFNDNDFKENYAPHLQRRQDWVILTPPLPNVAKK